MMDASPRSVGSERGTKVFFFVFCEEEVWKSISLVPAVVNIHKYSGFPWTNTKASDTWEWEWEGVRFRCHVPYTWIPAI
jgi:hypothetical protein